MPATDALVFDAIRTPRGKGKVNGSLARDQAGRPRRRPDARDARSATSASTPSGSTTSCSAASRPVGDQGADIAKTAAIKAGLPDTVAGVQLNRFCASGLEAVNIAAQKVASGWEDLVFAGGVESMSRVPMGSDGGAWAMDPETNYDTSFIPQGVGADLIATVEEFSREDVDAYAARSQERAAAAQAEGRFADSRRPGQGPQRARRPRPRRVHPPRHDRRDARQAQAVASRRWARWAASTPSRCRSTTGSRRSTTSTRPATRRASSTAPRCWRSATSRPATSSGLTPQRAHPRHRGLAAPTRRSCSPAPRPRRKKALAKAGITVDELDLVEINEAFAAVVLRFVRDMGLDMEKVNVNGGAIAMGHPLGATGGMILGTLIDELHRTGGRYGLATLCVGGGMGIATVVEAHLDGERTRSATRRATTASSS